MLTVEGLDLAAIRARCPRRLDGASCYRLLESYGLRYGPGFRSVQAVSSGDTEALVELRLPAGETGDYMLHPCLLDGALHGIVGLGDGVGAGGPYLPFSLGRLELLDALPAHCYAHLRRASAPGTAVPRFDVTVADAGGRPLARLSDLSLRALQPAAETLGEIYCRPVWRESAPATGEPPEGPLLLLDTGPQRRLQLAAQGLDVLLVTPGDEFEVLDDGTYVLDPAQPDHYGRLLDALAATGRLPAVVAHLWCQAQFSTESLEAQLEHGVYALLHLCQAWLARVGERPLRLLACYLESKDGEQPAYGGLAAFLGTLRQEQPRLAATAVALEGLEQAADAILDECRRQAGGETRHAQGRRWVRALEEWKPEPEAPRPLRQGGVYLLSGGAGGLGLLFAEHLLRTAQAKVVLCGRSSLDEARVARLAAMNATGGEAVYLQADVCDPQAVRELVTETRRRFGAIHGVVHCAGVLRDGLLAGKSAGDMAAVLAPKLLGCVHLDAATREDRLDFFMLCSSIAALQGNRGQADYAYANGFLDAYARWREMRMAAGERSGRTLSVAWPLWRDGGMRVDASTERLLEETAGMQVLDTAAGLAAWSRLLAAGPVNVAVLAGRRARLRQALGLAAPAIADRQDADPALRNRLERDLIALSATILKVPDTDIDAQADMAEYGFDSITFTELANRLNETYGLDLTPAVFFEHPSMGAFAAHLCERSHDLLAGHYGGAKAAATEPVQDAAIGPLTAAARYLEPTARVAPAPEGVAIIGMSGMMPQSPDLESFWQHLQAGEDLITEVPAERWDWRAIYGDPAQSRRLTRAKWGGFMPDADKFDCGFFGISPREAELMDPQQRLFLQTVWKTIEDAGYRPSALAGSATGVYVGVASADYYELIRERVADPEAHITTGMSHAMLANRVSYLLDLHGPSEPIDTACSSSLVAIHRAVEAIRSGACELAIAGGVNLMASPTLTLAFSNAGMLCEDGKCKTFDAAADGYVRGEGVGALLLKPLGRAVADGDHVHAVVRGSAENHGGHAASMTSPNPRAQAEVLIRAYEAAVLDPATVGYIETHGTGTRLGDPIEINGLKAAFEALYARRGLPAAAAPHCGLGAVKTNIGHLETAAGIAGVCKVLLAMRHGELPPSLHLQEVNPYIRLEGSPFYLVTERRSWAPALDAAGRPLPRRAGVSSFGIGGANAHVVLEEHLPAPEEPASGPQIVVLSARDASRLQDCAAALLAHLEAAEPSLAALAYTLWVGREPMAQRLALVAADLDAVRAGLRRYCAGEADIPGLYRGGVAEQNGAAALLQGEAGAAFLEVALRQGDLGQLARLWVAGVDLDTERLFGGRHLRRLSLPTYPFARERHWLQPAQPGTGGPWLHPLLERNVSTLQTQRYNARYGGREPWLADHRVAGACTFPAAAGLELARAAGTLAGETEVQRLEDLVWLRPLTTAGGPLEVEISLAPTATGADFEVTGTAGGDPSVVHLQGRLGRQAEPEPPRADLDRIRARCGTPLAGEDCYRRLAALGLDYGPGLQAIRGVGGNATEALAELELPGGAADPGLVLPPALLDGALQAIVGLESTGAGGATVPFVLEALDILHPLPSRCLAWVQALPESGAVRRFDIDLLDRGGRVLVRLRGLAVKTLGQVEARRAPVSPVAVTDDLQQRTQDFLKGILARQAGIDAGTIRADAPLEKYGIDSMMVLGLTRALERQFGELSKTLFFEHQTLGELAAYFCAHHAGRLLAVLGDAPKAPEPPVQTSAEVPVPAGLSHRRFHSATPAAGDVAVIGLSGRYPQAADLSRFWENLRAGRDCITEIPPQRWDYRAYYDPEPGRPDKIYSKWGGFIDDVDKFDPMFFNISPREAEIIDPQERLYLQTVWNALEDAGVTRAGLGTRRVGVYVGVMYGEYQLYGAEETLKGNVLAPRSTYASFANRVSYFFNFQGPSLALDTMCSSSLTAMHLACESLRRGESELAVAGGVNLSIHPQKYLQLSQGRFASSDGRCRSFGADGDGYVPGEGVGAALLKPLAQALADGDHIYGVIKASAINHGGKTNGYTVPNPKAQAALIAETLDRAGVAADALSYIEAHGTGTSLGDPIEITGLVQAFEGHALAPGRCAIGSVKSNIGHLESAAGIAGLTKVLLQMRHGELVPSLHAEPLNPNIPFGRTPFRVQQTLGPWERPRVDGRLLPRRAGISSFGAGGANAHLIVEEHQPSPREPTPAGEQLVLLSARDGERLGERVDALLAHLASEAGADTELADLAYTLQVGREPMEARLALVVADPEALQRRLQAYRQGMDGTGIYLGDTLADPLAPPDGDRVDALLQAGVLDDLARLWAAGVPVDWSRLRRQGRPRRVPLPGYPFARERCWLPLTPAAVPGSYLHPLLDANASTLGSQRYVKRYSGTEPYLADHEVGGRRLLPGVVSLEMARAAGTLAKPEAPPQGLAEVVWSRPLVVDHTLEAHLSLMPQGEHIAFELASEAGLRVHVRGRLVEAAGGRQTLDLGALRDRCPTPVSAEACYRRLRRLGLRHGPAMRSLRALHLGAGEVLAELALPETALVDPALVLSPALMDGALQMLAALDQDESGVAYLPYGVESVSWHGSLPRRCVAHAVAREADARSRRYDLCIADEAGRVLVRLQGLTLRALQPAAGPQRVYLRRVWRETPAAASSAVAGPVLVLARNAGQAAALGARLGVDAVCVRPGDGFLEHAPKDYEISPGKPADYRRLLQVLAEGKGMPRAVVHLWSIAETPEQDLGATLAHGIQSLLHLSQALLERQPTEPLRLAYLHQAPGGVVAPAHAGVAGFARTLRQENPNLPWCSIALADEAAALEAVAAELAGGTEEELCYAGGGRRARALEEVEPGETPAQRLLRQGGVYLITGGAGGLGLLLAEHLIRTVRARVVLMGRSAPDARLGARLEALGGEVLYLRGDVCRRQDVEAVLGQLRERYGALHGVFHAAGVLRDGLLLRKSAADFAEVLAPKLRGTMHLDAITADDALDFFVLCSSIAALLGNVGQADYAYANGFLDAYAEQREALRAAGRRRGRTLSIGWPLWQDGGMPIDAQTVAWARQALGLEPLDTAGGLAALEQLLASEHAAVAVLSGDAARIRGTLLKKPDAPVSAAEVVSAATDAGSLESVQDHVKGLLAAELKLDPRAIRPRESFERYGLDSVSMLNITRALEQRFGELPKTLLYEHESVAALAGHLAARYPVQARTLVGGTEPDASPMLPPEAPAARALGPRFESAAPRPAPAGEQDIAIVGLAGRYPMAEDVDALWQNLVQGRDCITEIPAERWDHHGLYDAGGGPGKVGSKWGGFLAEVDKFDPYLFNVSPREAAAMDPQERLFLQTVWHTLEDAGYSRRSLEHRDVGVYVGVMWGDYQLYGPAAAEQGNPILPGSSFASIANRISFYFNFHGPSMALDTMCSSSLTALHLACWALRRGECEAAVAGGVNLALHPQKYRQLSQGNFTSSDGRCRSFGAGGDGYVPGEGVGAVLLKPLARALEDGDHVYAIVKGSWLNHGGKTSGYTVPNPSAQGRLVSRALERAGVDPATVGYIEAHGTGTAMGDPIEIAGLAKAFQDRPVEGSPCAIGSIKSNIGHLESAAGIAGLTKVLLQLRHRTLVPSLHAETLNPNLRLEQTSFRVQRELTEWPALGGQPRRAGISSFGAGGANAHLIVEEYVQPRRTASAGPWLVPLSARTEAGLRALASRLTEFLEHRPEVGPAELAYTLQVGREPMPERLALVVSGLDELQARLRGFLDGAGESCRRGSAQGGGSTLLEGRAGAAFLQVVLEERDLDRLVRLWVDGTELDWSLLYPAGTPARISLPGYVFERRRCWLDLAATPAPRPATAPPPVVEPRSARGRRRLQDPLSAAAGLDAQPEAAPRIRASLQPTAAATARAEPERPSGKRADMRDIVRRELARVLLTAPEDVDEQRSFAELGVDSVLGVELMRALNAACGLELDATKLYDHPTVVTLADYLATQLGEGPAPAVEPAAGDGVEAIVRRELARVLLMAPEDVDGQRSFAELGVDSVLGVELVHGLNAACGLALDATLLYDHATVERLSRFLAAELGRRPAAAPQPEPAAVVPEAEPPAVAAEPEPPAGNPEHIAVVGMAARFPGAEDLEQLWACLRDGVCTVTEIPAQRWSIDRHYDPDPRAPGKSYCKWGGFLDDVARFDALFFSVSPADAEMMDPQQRLFLEVAWSALEHAGYSAAMLDGMKCGVYLGAMGNEYLSRVEALKPAQAMMGNAGSILPARIAYLLNLKGPVMTLDTACSSSLVAIHAACGSLRNGDADLMLAGGISLYLTEKPYISMSKGGMLSADGKCKAFDDSANGFVPGEGVGVVVLKRLDRALADGDPIHGVILGSGVNQDGRTNGITAPSAESQRELELAVYQRYGIDPETIGYVEAHGTGTKLGDPIELSALTQSFRRYTERVGYCHIGSVKSNLGHTSAAAGVAGVIKVLLCMRHAQIPPTLHFQRPNEHIRFADSPFVVTTELTPWEAGASRRAAVSSFGFSGTNCHLVLEQPAVLPADQGGGGPELIVLSARSPERLREYARRLSHGLDDASLTEVAWTLQIGRTPMTARLALVVSDVIELRRKLEAYAGGRDPGAGVYTGDADGRSDLQELLAEDENGQGLLERLIRGRKLERLARLWVGGVSVDWRLLHGPRLPRRVSLPTYPFARERHWAAVDEEAPELATAWLHPLLQRNGSTLQGIRYLSAFTGREYFLAEHRVGGRATLPGAAQLEMARAAGTLAGEQPVTRLTDVLWLRPLQLDGAREVELRLHSGAAAVDFELRAGEALYGQGRLHHGAVEPPGDLGLTAIRARCGEVVAGAQLYARLESQGLEYGPRFRALRRLHYGEAEALGTLDLSPDTAQAQDWVLHPALLDGALHTVAGLQAPDAGGALPFGVAELRIFGPLPSRCHVHASPQAVAEPGTRRYNLDVCDETGRVLVQIRGFALRPVDPGGWDSLYFRKVWESAPVPEPAPQPAGMLLLDVEPHRAEALRRGLGGPVVLVTPGAAYAELAADTYTIDPAAPADYARLLGRLIEQGRLPGQVVHLWSSRPFVPEAEAVAGTLSQGIYSLLHLTQALLALRLEAPPRLVCAALGSQPLHSALSAYCRTLSQEAPKLQCRSLLLADPEGAVEVLLAECSGAEGEEVRYAEGRRWLPALREVELGAETPPLLRLEGVYLLSGGAGGLGLVLAEHLVRRWRARVVLAGRSALNPAQRERVAALGPQLLYLQADVTDRRSVETLVGEVRARFGALHGVMHAAGVLRDAWLASKNQDDFAAVLAPKIYGALHLDAATAQDALDCFVLYSSIAGTLGNPGQTDYAYANAFLDGFAEWREVQRGRGRRHGRTVSMGWPLWQDGGMSVDPQIERIHAERGLRPLSADAGMQAFERMLGLGEARVLCLHGSRKGIEGLSAPQAPPAEAQPSMAGATGALAARLEQELLEAAARILKIRREALEPEKDLTHYGVDSIGFLEFAGHLSAGYGIEVAPTVVFEHTSIRALAGYLCRDFAGALVAHYGTKVHPAPEPSAPAASGYDMPLSYGQRALWYLLQTDPDSAAYNVAFQARVCSVLDVAALDRALQALILRHAVLRACFLEQEDALVQRIASTGEVPLRVTDASAWNESELKEQVRAAYRAPFDLRQGPLLRAEVYSRSTAEHVLLLTIHHIVVDAWSLLTLIEELGSLYQAEAAGHIVDLAPPTRSYGDFVASQAEMVAGPTGAEQWDYWRQRLGGELPVLELPTDRPRPPVQTSHGGSHRFRVPVELSGRLRRLAQAEGVTPFVLLLSAFYAWLHRWSGAEDVLVGSPTAGRSRPELAKVVGYLVNTVVLRADLSGDPSFAELLGRVRPRVLEALKHQDLPFPLLVERLQPRRDPSRSPLFQVCFVYQGAPKAGGLLHAAMSDGPATSQWGGLTLAPYELAQQEGQFDLTLEVFDAGEQFVGALVYNSDLFEAGTISRMADSLLALLNGIVAAPTEPVSRLPIMDAVEHRRLLQEWNATRRDYPLGQGLHELVAARARSCPEATAVVYEGDDLSYGALEQRANQLAHRLIAMGVRPDVLVGVCLERSTALVVALYAVLKAGGAYVPLEPEHPPQRLAFMVHDGAIDVIVSRRLWADRLPSSARVLWLDTDWPAECPTAPPAMTVAPDDLAYVIYTSGTTGRPKGAMNTHRAICNRLLWMQEAYDLSPADRVLQKTPYGFDVSVWELFWPLLAGATLVVARPGGHRDSAYLAELIEREHISTVHFVPSMLRVFLDEPRLGRCPGLRRVICSGEALPVELQERCLDRLDAELHNLYGPTEAAVDVTFHACVPARGLRSVPIGRPIANTRIYLLDRHLQPVPRGVTGELYIAGVAVGRGYLNRPELTAQKFLPDPYGPDGGTMYRSGDLARYLPDGNIEFLGRIDHQIKIRGLRIEPGEIEAALGEHPGVRESVVVARPGPDAEPQLVGYYVPAGPGLESETLLAHLRGRLPEYMVPAVLTALQSMPLSVNGKLDRRSLPSPETPAAGSAYQPPRTELERTLAAIWGELLGLERVGVEDDFFRLGGHSLLAARVVSRLRHVLGAELQVAELLEGPTIARLAARLEGLASGAGAAAIPLAAGAEPVLSFAQERMWFLARLEGAAATYNVPLVLRLKGPLDLAALQRAMDRIVARHGALRSRIQVVDGSPRLEILPDLVVPVVEHGPSADTRSLIEQEILRPFDLSTDALIRCALLHLGDEHRILIITAHHIVCDGWSLGVLLRELGALYAGAADATLAELPVQYHDYAAWQRQSLRGEALEAQLGYWRRRLEGLPPLLELVKDHPRPALQASAGAGVQVAVSPELTRALRQLGSRHGATLFMTLLAAFKVLLQRYGAQDDIPVGTPVANRSRRELEPLIGLFVNTLVLCTDLSGNPGFEALLGRVRETALEAYAHQEVPFEQVVEALRPARSTSYTPLFQVMFALQSAPAEDFDLPGLEVSPVTGESPVAQFDLTLDLTEIDGGLRGLLVINTDLYERSTAEAMAQQYRVLLAAIARDPGQRLWDLPLQDGEQLRRVLAWSSTGPGEPEGPAVHEVVSAAARANPAAIAVREGSGRLSYGELGARAERLAAALQALDLQPGTAVGLCLEGCVDAVVGLLGILLAGGVYLPLSPGLPAERLARLARAAGAGLILGPEGELPALPGCRTVDIGELLASPGGRLRPVPVDPERVAYIIYTSGSTGEPKGVAVSHGALAYHCREVLGYLRLVPEDRVLQFASLCFDASLEQILPALMCGASLVLREAQPWTPAGFAERVREAGMTVADLPPAYLHELLLGWEGQPELAPAGLRLVIVGGEALAPATLELWRRSPMSRVRLLNAYGPTEATITATIHEAPVEGPAPARVPLGRPLPGRRVYVLDPAGRPCPAGVPGELHIGGRGLALGYVGDPEQTAECFLPDPYAGEAAARMYRTGDRARYLADGRIDFLGRLDRQVKLRGYRIEPAEIEAVLATAPGVRGCALVLRGELEAARLVAYVVPAQADAEPEPLGAALRAFLAGRLPAHMLPAEWVVATGLPYTAGGKIDRKALPPVERDAQHTLHLPPDDPIAARLVRLWSEVLGCERVGIHDSFFDLGGHSLLSVRLMARIGREFGTELPLASLLQHPTIEHQARLLRDVAGTAPDSPLVLIRAGGSRPPFFCVHGAAGTVLGYRSLAEHLGDERPFYGIQAPTFCGRPMPATVEEMAAVYLGALREVQPEGPYHVGGWSFGGVVAYEMARQLAAAGQEIGALVLIDSYPAAVREAGELDEALLTLAAAGKQQALEAADLPDDPVQRMRSIRELAQDAEVEDDTVRLVEVYRSCSKALVEYTPEGYGGALLLLRAAEAAPDCAAAWLEHASREAQTHIVPGNHYTLLQEPRVSELAAAIQTYLDGRVSVTAPARRVHVPAG